VTEGNKQHHLYQVHTVSWWSWRPGIKPRIALCIGSLITCIALIFTTIGLLSLVFGILDSVSSPLRLSGIVINHSINAIDGQTNLLVSIHATDFPPHVSVTTDKSIAQTVHDGASIVLDYTPHLHVLLALESAGQHFPIQNGGLFSIFLGTFTLLLLGLAMLPYPALLTSWAWHDLYGRKPDSRQRTLTGKVIALREAIPKRANRPGLSPRPTRTWYGVALAPLDASAEQPVLTFAIPQDMYKALREGEIVRITYSSHIHYVYKLEPFHEYE
jgi:hypothetical protein